MKKRVLSLILALVLCVGLLPVAASAWGDPTENNRQYIANLPENPGKPVLVDVTKSSLWPTDYSWGIPADKEEVFSQVEALTYELIDGKKTETDKAKAIFDWVAQNISYDYEALRTGDINSAQQSGMKAFYKKKAICDGYAKLLQLMNVLAGLPSVYISADGKTQAENHAWNALYADGRWIFCDPTWNKWDMDPYFHSEHTIVIMRYIGDFALQIESNYVCVVSQAGLEVPKNLVLPDYVNYVDFLAYYNREELESVVIPKNIEYIGNVFMGCKNLKTVIFEDGNDLNISYDAFKGCPLTSVKLPDGLTKLEGFLHDTPITDIVIPDTVTEIFGLRNCANLRNIKLPDRLEKLHAGAFENCTGLTGITVPYGVEEIGGDTFSGCTSLKSVILPDSVTTICFGSFNYCTSLDMLYIPSSVTKMETTNCFSLVPNVVIYTEPGSYAETYAKGNNIKVVTSGVPTPTPAPADSSTPSGWAQAEVSEAAQAGLVPGDLLSSYTSAINREEFCRLMVRLIEAESGKDIAGYAASQGKEVSAPFTDTSSQEVKAAYTLGIVNGVSETVFNPGGSITRQEAAAMLERTAKVLGLSSGSSISFSDGGSIASWAAGSVAFVSGLTDPVNGSKVMGGVGGNSFDPAGTYTREQAIATALRLFHCAG